MSFTGIDISEYTVSHGFTPGSYSAGATTSKAAVTPTLTAKLTHRNHDLISQLGSDYIHRFQQADQTKNLGGEGLEKDPLASLISTTRDIWGDIRDNATSIALYNTHIYDISRSVSLATASNTLLDGNVPHDTAVQDREREEESDRQDTLQTHKTSENVYLRAHRTTMQNDQQSWIASESLLDRGAETDYQDADQLHKTTEAGYVRAQKSTIASDKYLWEAAESLLDRNAATSLQDDEQTFRASETAYGRTQKTTIQNDRQSWEAAETLLDRTAETNLQDADQVHRASESAYARTAQSTLASDQFVWEAAESLLDRTSATNLQDDEQSHKGTEAGYARAQKTTVQNDRQSFEAAETVLDRSAETTLQNTSQATKANTTADVRTAEATRNIKQLNADYSVRDFAYLGLLPFLMSYMKSPMINPAEAEKWGPAPASALDAMYRGGFYRGLHLCTTDDWYDVGD